MTKEQEFFLGILSDHLHHSKTTPVEGIDWAQICSWAQMHQLSGMVFRQCQMLLPPGGLTDQLRMQYAASVYYYTKRTALFQAVTHAFSDAGIPFFVVKGFEVAKFYPIPELRTMGDCDLVVHSADKERALAVFEALGFSFECRDDMEWSFSKQGIEFELHDRLLYDVSANSKQEQAFCRRAWDFTRPSATDGCVQLNREFHMVFLLLHLKRHLTTEGVGFRQFLDIAVVSQKCDLDWALLRQYLGEIRLLSFAQTCFALIEAWFGFPNPLCSPALDEAFVQEATELVFQSGVFGFGENHSQNPSEKPGVRIRFLNLLRQVFPPYGSMYTAPRYAFLRGKPWLLPIAWVYRWLYSATHHHFKSIRNVFRDTLNSAEQINETHEDLSQWGL